MLEQRRRGASAAGPGDQRARRPERNRRYRREPLGRLRGQRRRRRQAARGKLGYKVDYKELTEQVSWEGFETGEVDAILENWGHADLAKTYITDKKVAVDAGSTGVDGDHRLVRAAVDGDSTRTSPTGTT